MGIQKKKNGIYHKIKKKTPNEYSQCLIGLRTEVDSFVVVYFYKFRIKVWVIVLLSENVVGK